MKKLFFLFSFSVLTCSALFSQEKIVNRTPVEKLADLLINYSLELKPNEHIFILTNTQAQELNLELVKRTTLAGAYPSLFYYDDEYWEVLYRYASDEQLKHSYELWVDAFKRSNAYLEIISPSNAKSLNTVDPEKFKMTAIGKQEYRKIIREKVDKKEYRWCISAYPTAALAQEAEMGTLEYKDFVFYAGKLYDPDPISSWKNSSADQNRWANWLAGKKQIEIKGTNIDMTMSCEGRKFIVCDGKENFPDGEIYCSPVEDSANGWVQFTYPVIYQGKEIQDLKLWFEKGKVVKHQASKGDEFVDSILETDEGAKVLGEFGIGTNYEITRFSKHMLFDEKIGGTIHLAIGAGYSDSGGKNISAIHLDLLCDMKESQILVNGELFYKDGKFMK